MQLFHLFSSLALVSAIDIPVIDNKPEPRQAQASEPQAAPMDATHESSNYYADGHGEAQMKSPYGYGGYGYGYPPPPPPPPPYGYGRPYGYGPPPPPPYGPYGGYHRYGPY